MDLLVLGYGTIVSGIAFLLFGIDKWCAKQEFYRIPERILLGVSVLGGAVGAFFGMHLFRHKTRKPKFFIGIPILMCLQVLVNVLLMIIL